MFQTKVIEKIKTRVFCSITFLPRSRRLSDNVEKHGGARERPHDIAHVHFILDN